MSIIDTALMANRNYAKRHDPKLGQRPAPKIAVVTCMDPRLSNLPEILGLPYADIDVIRTGGPAVTEDVLGELVVSTRVLGTTEIMLLNHTGCVRRFSSRTEPRQSCAQAKKKRCSPLTPSNVCGVWPWTNS